MAATIIGRNQMAIRRNRTIHCITNIVTVNDCANILHAMGASPVMAHNPLEVQQVTASADALVINLGATEDFEAMKLSAKAADEAQIPIVIDPVGAGGIDLRRQMFYELMEVARPTCIRGNMAEIEALLVNEITAVGVDDGNQYTGLIEEELAYKSRIVKNLANKYGCIVVASGKTDIISDGIKLTYVEAGTEMMKHITGTGCMSTALIGGYLADNNQECLDRVIRACECMGQCGELAAEKTRKMQAGIMTFRTLLIDEISIFHKICQ